MKPSPGRLLLVPTALGTRASAITSMLGSSVRSTPSSVLIFSPAAAQRTTTVFSASLR